MFRREVKKIDGLLSHFLRAAGLETPLLQRRLIDAWPEVAGQMVENIRRMCLFPTKLLW